jgi:hypothetical protein
MVCPGGEGGGDKIEGMTMRAGHKRGDCVLSSAFVRKLATML